MSGKRGEDLEAGETFAHPDMPVTLWRSVWIVLLWLVYCTACVLTGYYSCSGFSPSSDTESVTQPYRLSEVHYVYKKRPLPVLEENFFTVSEAVPVKAEAADTDADTADLKARVRQAIQEIDLRKK